MKRSTKHKDSALWHSLKIVVTQCMLSAANKPIILNVVMASVIRVSVVAPF
jgi:hypothetical protein